MNEFQNIESGKGILKDYYPDATSEALKRKRKRMAENKGMVDPDLEAAKDIEKQIGE